MKRTVCLQCKTKFEGKNFGTVRRGPAGLECVNFCSSECRTLWRTLNQIPEPPDPWTPKKASRSRSGPDAATTQAAIRKSLGPKETDISASIASRLMAAGAWNTRTPSGAVETKRGGFVYLCRKGTPDRIAAIGLHIWIEVKRPGEKPSDEQAETLATLSQNGALAFWVDDPADMDLIFDGLKRYAEQIDAIQATIKSIHSDVASALSDARAARKAKG